ncbi:MAG: DMT family transporter [Sphingopyxis sp.]
MNQGGWPAYAAIMLLAGIGIPIQAALNGALGGRIANPFAAAAIAATLAFTIAASAALANGLPRASAFTGAPIFWYFGGAFMAFYVISITFVGPRFGIGNAIFFVLLGQIISAAAIDHFGLFGAAKTSVTGLRIIGMALMALGLFLARKPAAG